METYDQKRRRLYGKQDLPIYLAELRKILKIDVDESLLLSIAETDLVRQNCLAKQLMCSYKILFNDKEKLKKILLESPRSKIGNYYVFTSYSKDCGAAVISTLNDFNFDFSYKAVPSGIITLTRVDLVEEIVLDFYVECDTEYLEVLTYEKPINL
ncbi:MAG: hypothetical protein ABI844_17630 [Saprospiraceae bacterium]